MRRGVVESGSSFFVASYTTAREAGENALIWLIGIIDSGYKDLMAVKSSVAKNLGVKRHIVKQLPTSMHFNDPFFNPVLYYPSG